MEWSGGHRHLKRNHVSSRVSTKRYWGEEEGGRRDFLFSVPTTHAISITFQPGLRRNYGKKTLTPGDGHHIPVHSRLQNYIDGINLGKINCWAVFIMKTQ